MNELGDVKLKENTNAWDTSTTLAVLVKFVADNSSYVGIDADEDVVDFAKFLNGFKKGTNALEKAIAKLNKFEDGVNKNNYDDAKDLYKEITDNEDYFNAVVEAKMIEKNFLKRSKAQDWSAEDYRGENEDTFVKEYVRQLEKLK